MTGYPPGAQPGCMFCDIVSGVEPASVRYEDEHTLVFDNILTWVPVMLLVVPKRHLSQVEFWSDMDHYAKIAVRMGQQHCPGGFRILSNFDRMGAQSQPHGHLHVLGGRYLGPYVTV